MSTIKQIPVKKPTYSFGNKSYTEEELVKAFPDAYQQYQMAYGGKIPQHGFGQWLGKNAGAIGAVAGGIGGFFLGGPAGASAGAKLGSMAGNKISERQAEKDAEKLQAEQSGVAPMTPEIVEPEVVRQEAAIGMFPNGGSLNKPSQIFTYDKRPGVRYGLDEKGNWLVNVPDENNRGWILLDDPDGSKSKELYKNAQSVDDNIVYDESQFMNPDYRHLPTATVTGERPTQYYKNFVKPSIQFLDPTGMTSWGDVKDSYDKNGLFSGETAFELLGALPLLGKIGKSGKILGPAFETLIKANKTVNKLPVSNKTKEKLFKTIGKSYDKVKSYDNVSGSLTKSLKDNIKYIDPTLQKANQKAIDAFNTVNKTAKLANKAQLLDDTGVVDEAKDALIDAVENKPGWDYADKRILNFKLGGTMNTHYAKGGPLGGKLTKRQAKRAKEGKKGRYIKEGPLTFEDTKRLDAIYPATEMMPIPYLNRTSSNPNEDESFAYGAIYKDEEEMRRAIAEEKLRRKRNFNEDDGESFPSIMYPMQMKLGGSTPSQFEAEGGEVIQGDGIQINGGGGNPSLSYRAYGGAMINGVDHKESSANPNSGVKMATSGATEGRIFSKKLKSPTTKRPFSEEADKLLKKIGKYEDVIKNKSSEAISRRTSQIMADKYNAKLDELFEEQEEMKAEQGIPAQPGRAEEAGEFAKALDANAVPPNAPTPETLDMIAQQMSQMPMEEMGGNLTMFPNGGSLNLNAYRSGNENGDTVATDLELRTKNRLRAAVNGEIPIQDNSKFKVNRLSVGYNQPTKKGNFGVEVNSYPTSRKKLNPEVNTSYNYSNKKGNFNLGINNVMRKDSYFNPNLSMQYNFAYGGYTGQGGYRNAALDFYNNQEPDQGGLSEEALEMMDKTKDREGNATEDMPEITTEDKKDSSKDMAQSDIGKILTKSVMAAAGIPAIAKYGGKLPQHGDGSMLQNIGAGVGAATPLPTMFYDFAQGRKDPYEWERLQNEQKQNALNQFGNASGNLGAMGETVGDMDSQAVRDFQASRDIYAGMGDLDVSQQRADASNAAGNQMYALRGGAGSRAEMLAGAQNVQGQRQAQMGSIEAYKNKFDLDTQKMKAAGMNKLGSSEGSLQSQKASLYGSLAGQQGMLGGMYQNMGQQDREYAQYVNELNKQELDLRNAQKRSGWAGLGKFVKGAGTSLIGMGTNIG